MSLSEQLKILSMPKIDEALDYTGLQRTPSIATRVLAGAGLLGIGALIGAGLGIWLGSPKKRRELSIALVHGIDKVAAAISEPEAECDPVANHDIVHTEPSLVARVVVR